MRINEIRARKKTAGALGLALLFALSMGPVLAQGGNIPVENPSESDFLNALAGGLQSKAFRRTAAPDSGTHACPEVMVAGTTPGGTGKNLAPVPYAPDGAPSINLAINFATNSDRVPASSFNGLNNLANALKSQAMSGTSVAVAGHTDAQGNLQTNLKLSCARAISVRSYLIARGVEPERLGAYGFGPNRPLESTTVSAINRRVEIRRAN